MVVLHYSRQSAEKKRPGSAGPSRPGSAGPSRPGSAASRPGSAQGMRPSNSNQVNWEGGAPLSAFFKKKIILGM